MASMHILPVLDAGGRETLAGAIAGGRASALFAVLAGVGVALATGGPRPPARAARTPGPPRGCWCAGCWWRSSGSRSSRWTHPWR